MVEGREIAQAIKKRMQIGESKDWCVKKGLTINGKPTANSVTGEEGVTKEGREEIKVWK